MIIGYLLLIGGMGQLVAGIALPETALATVGGLWCLAGVANVAMSLRARARTATDPAGSTVASGPFTADDLADPIARARRYRGTDGALARGLIALACAAVAVGVGAWTLIHTDLAAGPEPWAIVMVVTGAVVGFLCLVGLLVYAGSGIERAAIHPATVVILGMKETALYSSGRQPYVRFVLDVYPQGLPRYEATIQTPVPVLAVPKLAVGAQFPAQVAGPDKPNAVIVNWNEPLAPPRVAAPDPRPASSAPVPAASPAADEDPADRLRELDSLQHQGLISGNEYQAQRARILDSL